MTFRRRNIPKPKKKMKDTLNDQVLDEDVGRSLSDYIYYICLGIIVFLPFISF